MSRDEKAHPVSQTYHHDVEGIDGMGQRCGEWLRAAWAGSRAKNTARLLGISEAQAKRLLAGARPTSEQLGLLAKHFGWRFVNFIYEPAVGMPAGFAEMAAFDARLAKTQEEIRHVAAAVAANRVALAQIGESERGGGPGGDAGAPDGGRGGAAEGEGAGTSAARAWRDTP